MKLNTLLTQVFSRLGVDTAATETQALLGNPSIANIDVAESVSNKLQTEFFTKESALQNPEIRSKIRAEALNGIDSQIEEISSQFEFDEETKAAITKEDKSSKRLKKLVDTISELERKKTGTDGKNKDILNQKISELNDQILKTRTDYEAKLMNVEKLRKTDRIGWELDSIYNGLDYALPSEKSISARAAKSIVDSISASQGIQFETSEQGIRLLTSDGTDYFQNNVKVSPQDYIKKTLLENKLLKVSEQAQTAGRPAERSTGGEKNPFNRSHPPQPKGGFDAQLDQLMQGNPL